MEVLHHQLRFESSPTENPNREKVTGIQGMSAKEFVEWKNKIRDTYSQPIEPITTEYLSSNGYEPERVLEGKVYYGNGKDSLVYDEEGRVVEEWPEGLGGQQVEYVDYDEDGYIKRREDRYIDHSDPKAPKPSGYEMTFAYTTSKGQKSLTQISYKFLPVMSNLYIAQYINLPTVYEIDFLDHSHHIHLPHPHLPHHSHKTQNI